MAKVKESGIGRMIFDLRVKSEYTLNQLAKGVCSVSELSKFESDEIMLNFFQIDRLFSRLGKTPTKLEYVLSKEAYEIYKLRYYIEKNVATTNLNILLHSHLNQTQLYIFAPFRLLELYIHFYMMHNTFLYLYQDFFQFHCYHI